MGLSASPAPPQKIPPYPCSSMSSSSSSNSSSSSSSMAYSCNRSWPTLSPVTQPGNICAMNFTLLISDVEWNDFAPLWISPGSRVACQVAPMILQLLHGTMAAYSCCRAISLVGSHSAMYTADNQLNRSHFLWAATEESYIKTAFHASNIAMP